MDPQTIIAIGTLAIVLVVLTTLTIRAPKDALKDWGGRLITVMATGVGVIIGYYFQEPRVEQAQDDAVQAQMVADSAVTLMRDLRSEVVLMGDRAVVRPENLAEWNRFLERR
jgi:hypothetical protein